MAKISAMLDIGKRSMMNSQTSLQTVAHNIANKTNEGFSRQRVEQVTAVPVQEGRLQLGMGARAATVTRINSPYLDKQLQKETGTMGYFDGKAESLARVEQVFNEQGNKSLNQYISDFFNAFKELSNNPESVTPRAMVKETADILAKEFGNINLKLSNIQDDINLQMDATTLEINKMTREIAALNGQIQQVENQGIPANDQRDRRDLVLKKLNEKIDIKVAEGDYGAVSVSTAGNALLVSGLESLDLQSARMPDGTAGIYVQPTPGTPPFEITDRIKGGVMGGIIEVRDKTITDMKNKMDILAHAIAKETNAVHTQGFDRMGKRGVELFTLGGGGVAGASSRIKLNDAIADDVNRIVSAARPNAPADNTVANVISLIQYKATMEDGTSTIDDYYNSEVGRIGVTTGHVLKSRETQGNLLGQISNLRDSISGVSLDEEATKMIEFQRAFDASAKLITTADEMLETVLSLKR